MTEEKIVNIKKAGEPKKEQLVEKKEMTVTDIFLLTMLLFKKSTV